MLDENGAVADVLVEDGALQGDPARAFRLVILDFIASCVGEASAEAECGDGYPLKGLAAPDRVDLADVGVDPGASDFAEPGSEQDALAEYLAARFAETPYAEPETAPNEDRRIRNLAAR